MLLVSGVGGWDATAQLSGAVIAAGTLVVDTNVKKVQHPSGGQGLPLRRLHHAPHAPIGPTLINALGLLVTIR